MTVFLFWALPDFKRTVITLLFFFSQRDSSDLLRKLIVQALLQAFRKLRISLLGLIKSCVNNQNRQEDLIFSHYNRLFQSNQ